MMSDCSNCWDTPCTCGYEYRRWPDFTIDRLIRALQSVKILRKQQPHLLPGFPGSNVGDRDEEFRKVLNSLRDSGGD